MKINLVSSILFWSGLSFLITSFMVGYINGSSNTFELTLIEATMFTLAIAFFITSTITNFVYSHSS